jgi:hypothetical protein
LFANVSRLAIYLNYLANKTYYAEVLCENKDVEESCCEGKCAMEKELIAVEDDTTDSQNGANNTSELKLSKIEDQNISNESIGFFLRPISRVSYQNIGDKTCAKVLSQAIKPPIAMFFA